VALEASNEEERVKMEGRLRMEKERQEALRAEARTTRARDEAELKADKESFLASSEAMSKQVAALEEAQAALATERASELEELRLREKAQAKAVSEARDQQARLYREMVRFKSESASLRKECKGLNMLQAKIESAETKKQARERKIAASENDEEREKHREAVAKHEAEVSEMRLELARVESIKAAADASEYEFLAKEADHAQATMHLEERESSAILAKEKRNRKHHNSTPNPDPNSYERRRVRLLCRS